MKNMLKIIYIYIIIKNFYIWFQIVRYKTMYNSSEEKKWEDALSTYRKAYIIFPDNGRINITIYNYIIINRKRTIFY